MTGRSPGGPGHVSPGYSISHPSICDFISHVPGLIADSCDVPGHDGGVVAVVDVSGICPVTVEPGCFSAAQRPNASGHGWTLVGPGGPIGTISRSVLPAGGGATGQHRSEWRWTGDVVRRRAGCQRCDHSRGATHRRVVGWSHLPGADQRHARVSGREDLPDDRNDRSAPSPHRTSLRLPGACRVDRPRHPAGTQWPPGDPSGVS